MKSKPILEFAKMISGIFSNKEQALQNPKKFAHIQIHFRPLFLKTFKCYAFYSEQSYDHDKWNPYRQSINKLSIESGKYVVRSSNNGIAAIINPLGVVEQSVKFGKSGYIDLKSDKKIQPTIFSKYGNKIFGLLILLYIFLIFSFNKIKDEQS